MDTTEKRTMKRGMMTIILSVLMVWAAGATTQAESDNTLHVNVGESITLTVEGFTKLAVADPAVGDVLPLSSKEISVIGKKMGVTTITVIIPEKQTQIYRLEVGNDSIATLVRKVVNSPTISVRTVGDTVILDGYVNDELEAQRATQVVAALKGTQVLNLIEVRHPRQVRIRTRVAEVNSDMVKNIGFRWFNPNGEVQYALDFTGGGSILHGMVQPSSTGTTPTDPLALDIGADVILQLLMTKNYARLLSEPTLTTLSGKEASFLVGQEVPIVQQLPQSFTVEFKEVGVRMKIKPTVNSQNEINTTIHAEVSQVVGAGALGIPIIGTKQTDTSLQVKDGQTIVIGGLLENNINRDYLRKFPWLGDIPVLGLLFRQKETDKQQREVLFFMTPEIVKDVDADTANAAKSPLMRDWSKEWNAKILEVPKKGYDWSLAEPGSVGFNSSEKKSNLNKADKDRAKKGQGPSAKTVDKAEEQRAKPAAAATKTPAPAAPAKEAAPVKEAAPAVESAPASEPSSNFAPARPSGQ